MFFLFCIRNGAYHQNDGRSTECGVSFWSFEFSSDHNLWKHCAIVATITKHILSESSRYLIITGKIYRDRSCLKILNLRQNDYFKQSLIEVYLPTLSHLALFQFIRSNTCSKDPLALRIFDTMLIFDSVRSFSTTFRFSLLPLCYGFEMLNIVRHLGTTFLIIL